MMLRGWRAMSVALLAAMAAQLLPQACAFFTASPATAARLSRSRSAGQGNVAQLPLSSSRVAPTLGSLYMSDQERDTGRGSGTGVQVITKDRVKETVEEDTAAKEDLSNESWWRVILHNDEIHTFDYVTMSITKVVRTVTMKKAYEVTMETHKAGKATVTQSWKNQAEKYCLGLQQCGLTASIALDSKFEGGQGEDGEGGGGGGDDGPGLE